MSTETNDHKHKTDATGVGACSENVASPTASQLKENLENSDQPQESTEQGQETSEEAPKEAQAVPQKEAAEDHKPESAGAPPTAKTLTREEKIEQILSLRANINTLMSNIRDTKQVSDKFENENQYLQDYFGSLMKSEDRK